MCKRCWEARAKVVVQNEVPSETKMQTAGLVLGCIALLPLPAIQMAAVVVNIVGLVKAKEGLAREQRWKNTLGLVLACLGFVGFLVLVIGFGD
jgi:hypothetical protein